MKVLIFGFGISRLVSFLVENLFAVPRILAVMVTREFIFHPLIRRASNSDPILVCIYV